MVTYTAAMLESINKLLLEADKIIDYAEIPAGNGHFFLIRINTAKFREVAAKPLVFIFEISGNDEFAVCTKFQ